MSAAIEKANLAGGPIDLDHLRGITFSDMTLEQELLGLFSERASASLTAIEHAGSTKERSDAAHRLVGAARAIGANEVAEAAQVIEAEGILSEDSVGALSRSMAELIGFLENRLSRPSAQPEAS